MMNNNTVPISVIIPTLNRKNVLAGTINSLLSGNYIPDEIIVVDQSEIILEVKNNSIWSGIVKVVKEEVLSSARARNIGVKEAKNDIILFCDDDIEVNSQTIKHIYGEMSRIDIALISTINCMDNSVYDYQEKKNRKLRNIAGYLCGTRSFWKKGGYIVKWSMKGHYAEGMTKPHQTEWAYGFFFCVKKSLMEKWNVWFDEKLIKYAFAEDMDFSFRYCSFARKYLLKTIVDPCIYVHHLISNEWRMPSEEAIFYGFINRWYLSYKLFPHEWWYRIGMVWSDIWYTLLVFRKKEKILGLKAMLRTYTQCCSLKNGIIKRG